MKRFHKLALPLLALIPMAALSLPSATAAEGDDDGDADVVQVLCNTSWDGIINANIIGVGFGNTRLIAATAAENDLKAKMLQWVAAVGVECEFCIIPGACIEVPTYTFNDVARAAAPDAQGNWTATATSTQTFSMTCTPCP